MCHCIRGHIRRQTQQCAANARQGARQKWKVDKLVTAQRYQKANQSIKFKLFRWYLYLSLWPKLQSCTSLDLLRCFQIKTVAHNLVSTTFAISKRHSVYFRIHSNECSRYWTKRRAQPTLFHGNTCGWHCFTFVWNFEWLARSSSEQCDFTEFTRFGSSKHPLDWTLWHVV